MSTYKLKQNKAELIFYAVESVVTLVIGTVYELFSHQVYSPFMYLMFMIPLLLGLAPNLAARMLDKSFITSKVLTLIFGSFLKGVLDIYGTSSIYPLLYLPAAAVLIIVALGMENYYKKVK